jgi:hypothetical protein
MNKKPQQKDMSSKSKIREQRSIWRGMRILGLNTEEELNSVKLEDVKTAVSSQFLTYRDKMGLKAILRRRGLFQLGQWNKMCSDRPNELATTVVTTSGLQGGHAYRLRAVKAACSFFGISGVDDISKMTPEQIEKKLSEAPTRSSVRPLVFGMNLLLHHADRTERVEYHSIHQQLYGNFLSRSEEAWFVQEGSPAWFLDFKRDFVRWMQRDNSPRTIRSSNLVAGRVFSIVRAFNRAPHGITAEELNETLIKAVLNNLRECPTSLVNIGRGSRTGQVASPYLSICAHYRAVFPLVCTGMYRNAWNIRSI